MNYFWKSWQTLGDWIAPWINWLFGKEQDHEKRIASLERKVAAMSAELDKLKAGYEEFKTVVTDDLTNLLAKVAALQAQIDAAPSDTQGIKDLAAEVAADLQAAKDRIPDSPA